MWERLPSGDWLWRLRIRSEGAVSLNLGFNQFQLPEKAALYVHNPETDVVHGPYGKEDATDGQLWTPVVPGSEITVELKVPSSTRSNLALEITQVSHGFRSLDAAAAERAASKAQSCNIDVACSDANSWRNQVRSVALYSVNGTDLCSGSLINNTSRDGTPYFLSAEHCLQGNESAATSMVFYWNYQNPTCRSPGSSESGTVTSDNKFDQTSTGAILRMSYGNCETDRGRCSPSDIAGKADVNLVEIDDSVPSEYNLFLSGWDRRDFEPSSAVSIHHPQTHGKRITFENDPVLITGVTNSSNDTHLEVDWDKGTTERGSSGGPLFSPSKRIIGVLSWGGKGCEITDQYGRIHKAWNGGGTPATRLRDWLDPDGTGAQKMDGQPLVSPPAVSEFRVATVTDSSATLKWKAPHNDGSAPEPDRYDLRIRPNFPIETASDFENARRIENVPPPGPPGTRQKVTVGLNPDTSYYFAIQTLDAAKNTSPLVTSGDASPVTTLRVTRKPSPNPTDGTMKLGVSVEEEQSIRVYLFDVTGRRVRTLFDGTVQPFRQRKISAQLSSLSSGMYFLRIRGNAAARTEKIVVTR